MRDGHRGTRAVERLVEYAPATGGLALWLRHRDAGTGGGPGDPPVRTDGTTLVYAPSFDALPLDEQTGWVAHELLHAALRHPQRLAELREAGGDVDAQLFGLCADAIVDASLAELDWLTPPRVGADLGRLLQVGLGVCADPRQALADWDVERLYRAIDDRRERSSTAGGRRAGSRSGGASGSRGTSGEGGEGGEGGTGERHPDRGHGGTGDSGDASGREGAAAQGSSAAPARRDAGPADLEDGPRAARVRALDRGHVSDLIAPAPGEDPAARAEADAQWSARLAGAHAGDGAFSLLRSLAADPGPPRTPWEQVLRTRVARALSKRPGVSWSRPSRSWLANGGRAGPGRRMPWTPGTLPGAAVPRLVVVVDVSGSIDAPLLARFAREIDAIARRLEATVTVVVGDERVLAVHAFEPGRSRVAALEVPGGGGTDFAPLLAEAGRHRPDLVVVLTDLDGPAGAPPAWPVLWAVPAAARGAVAPFGRTLRLG